jgi:hypothetical protein
MGKMKGINAPDFRKSGLMRKMKGINAPDFRKSGLMSKMKGINALDFATGSIQPAVPSHGRNCGLLCSALRSCEK